MGQFPAGKTWVPQHLADDGPRYLALVDALERDITEGVLVDGHRLPPHRDLARQLGLSVGTVSKAYREAEQRGIISGRVGQGTFVRHTPARVEAAASEGPINLALNVPPSGREVRFLSDVLGDIAGPRELSPLLDYHPHGGVVRHREVIADFVSEGAFPLTPSRLFLCNGAQHAIDVALRLVSKPGDTILVDALTYSGFKAVAAANQMTLVPVAMDDEGLIPEALEEASRASGARVLYTMPTLQSPTTRTMSVQRREIIAAMAERLKLWIIEDDVYGFFVPRRPVTLAELAPGRTFYVTSFSKCVAPGFRLGTLTTPVGFTEKTDLLMHASAWFVTPALSEIAVRLIESGRLAELIAERRVQAVERHRIFTGIFGGEAVQPEFPGFYGWLKLRGEWSAMGFFSAARSIGILVTPPDASSVDEADPGGIRICLGGLQDLSMLDTALRRLERLAEKRSWNVLSVA